MQFNEFINAGQRLPFASVTVCFQETSSYSSVDCVLRQGTVKELRRFLNLIATGKYEFIDNSFLLYSSTTWTKKRRSSNFESLSALLVKSPRLLRSASCVSRVHKFVSSRREPLVPSTCKSLWSFLPPSGVFSLWEQSSPWNRSSPLLNCCRMCVGFPAWQSNQRNYGVSRKESTC